MNLRQSITYPIWTQRENGLKKLTVSGTHEIVTNDVQTCHQSPERKEGEGEAERLLEEMMAEIFPKDINHVFKKLSTPRIR